MPGQFQICGICQNIYPCRRFLENQHFELQSILNKGKYFGQNSHVHFRWKAYFSQDFRVDLLSEGKRRTILDIKDIKWPEMAKNCLKIAKIHTFFWKADIISSLFFAIAYLPKIFTLDSPLVPPLQYDAILFACVEEQSSLIG